MIGLDAARWKKGCTDQQFDDGRRLGVWQHGAGQPVVMLHGFPTWSIDWQPVAERLAGAATLIVPDLLGYGFSDRPHRPVPIFEQADLITMLLDRLGVGRLTLVAHDLGCIVAQELLARDAGRFTSVILLNSGIVFDAYRPTRAQQVLSLPIIGPLVAQRIDGPRLLVGLAAVSGDRAPMAAEDFAELSTGMLHRDGHKLAHFQLHYNAERKRHHRNWEAALAAVKAPLSLVWGLADPVSGARVLERAKVAYPHAKITALPGIGHYPHLEAPDAVAEAIKANLKLEQASS
jgi:pimeloyl-ACP methyl ester carboxylesterase